eukprot:1404999-Amphidinium_carterae.1
MKLQFQNIWRETYTRFITSNEAMSLITLTQNATANLCDCKAPIDDALAEPTGAVVRLRQKL